MYVLNRFLYFPALAATGHIVNLSESMTASSVIEDIFKHSNGQ